MEAVGHDLLKLVKYIATLNNVLEVSLRCAADGDHWNRTLERVGLHACRRNDNAEILISAASARYMGLPVRELSFSVSASRAADASSPDGYYLTHAYHASRIFAFLERKLFRTPYYPAGIDVSAQPSASIKLTRGAERLFQANRSQPLTTAPETDVIWELPIFLPPRTKSRPGVRELFHARISGRTRIVPFSPDDTLDLPGTQHEPALAQLADSHLTALEWHIRETATHSRSKTVTEPMS